MRLQLSAAVLDFSPGEHEGCLYAAESVNVLSVVSVCVLNRVSDEAPERTLFGDSVVLLRDISTNRNSLPDLNLWGVLFLDILAGHGLSVINTKL